MDYRRFAFAAVAMLACGAFVYWPSPRKVESPVVTKVSRTAQETFFQRMADEANATGLDWQPAAFAIAVHDDAAAIPGIASCLAWREFTPEYVRGLYRRRAETIAWARAEGHAPLRVTFIGTIHAGEDTDPGQMLDLLQSQAAVVDTVSRLAPTSQVVTIEMSGADGALTWDRYMESANAAVARYEGLVIDRSQGEPDMIAHPEINGDVTLLRGTGFPPVIFGEELTLHHLDQWLLYRMSSGAVADSGDAAPLLQGLVRHLRTEMAVVRALEYLRATGGNSAIITQGFGHADDFDEIEPNYRVDFDVRIPVRPGAR